MIRFSQQDPRWADEKLGHSSNTIKNWGCLLCCTATACQRFGYGETPATLNEKFKAIPDGFDGALINHWKLAAAIPGMKYVNRIKCYDPVPAPIEDINHYLANGYVVVVLVDYYPDQEGIQNHWVVLEAPADNDYIILDPWPLNENGGAVSLMARFGKGKASIEAAIYDVVVFGGSTSSPTAPTTPVAEPVEAITELPKAGDLYRPVGDYVNDRLKPLVSAVDVGDTTGAIILTADAVTDVEGNVWAPHEKTITVYSAITWKGKALMQKSS